MLFWPEISVTGVLLNFDNERMHPLNTKVHPILFTLKKDEVIIFICLNCSFRTCANEALITVEFGRHGIFVNIISASFQL